jgi:cytoskeleton protein RodZ
MTSIGERLRRQRLEKKISIENVALDTKIGVRLLEAIEAEQFYKLPGGVFRKSFVLQYARALGMDPDEIAADLQHLVAFDEVPAIPTLDMMTAQESQSSSGFSFGGDLSGVGGSTVGSLLAALGVIMACALVYSWWQTPRRATAESVVTASATPAASVPASPVPASPVPGASVPAAPVPTQAAPPSSAPAQPAVAQPASVHAAGVQTAPAAAPPSAGASVRVSLSADEKTWISISSDGKYIFANSLEPHETKIIEASEKVRLLIGNAGGLEITLNGKPIGPIGPKGQVRVVELTPAGFHIVPRKPPTVDPL